MQGICAECGLDFEWWWMFRAQFHPWLFEHQWRRRFFRSMTRTMLGSCRGSTIANEAALMHPIRLRPLSALIVGLALITLAIWLAGLAYARHQFAITPPAPWAWNSRLVQSLDILIHDGLTTYAAFLMPVFLLPPLCFLFIPTSLQRVKVRPSQIVRMTLYWFIGAATLVLLFILIPACWQFTTGVDAPLILRLGEWQFPADPFRSDWMTIVFTDSVRPMWLGAIIWAYLWWTAACRDYLRLPDATLTVTLLMIIVTLASYLAQYVVRAWGQLM